MQQILVVGAGIVGISIARALQSSGAQVTLIDKSPLPPQRGTSQAWVAVDPTLAPTPDVVKLILASQAFMERPPPYYGPLLRPAGVVHIAGRDSVARLMEPLSSLDAFGVPAELLTQDKLIAAHPELSPEHALAAIRIAPDAAPEVQANSLVDGQLKLFKYRGGKLLRSTELVSADFIAGVWRVVTNQGEIVADAIVNAAGAEADGVATRCGVAPKGLTVRRRTFAVGKLDTEAGPAPPRTRSPFMSFLDANGRLIFRTEPHGEIWFSAAEDSLTLDAEPGVDAETVAIALARTEVRTRYRVRPHLTAVWAGALAMRPSGAAAGNPIIGWDPKARDFFWAAGFADFGVQCAVAVGDMAADIAFQVRREWALYEDFQVVPGAFRPEAV